MSKIRPSGAQQRKVRKAKDEAIAGMSGSMFKYLKLSSSQAETESSEDIMQAGPSAVPVVQMSQDTEDTSIKDNSESESSSSGEQDLEQQEMVSSDIYSDIAAWPTPVPRDLRVTLVKRGSEAIQNKDGPFSAVQREGLRSKGESRHLTTSWFYKSIADGGKMLRSWMIYSKSSNSLFCFCCKLFGENTKAGVSTFMIGFNSWWKLNPRVSDHEVSDTHLSCLEKWRALATGLKVQKTIDAIQQIEIGKERQKWRDILRRLLDIILFLARQNLAFRGHSEEIS